MLNKSPGRPPSVSRSKIKPVWRYGQGFPRDYNGGDYPYPEMLTPPVTVKFTQSECYEVTRGRFARSVPMTLPKGHFIRPNGKPGHFERKQYLD